MHTPVFPAFCFIGVNFKNGLSQTIPTFFFQFAFSCVKRILHLQKIPLWELSQAPASFLAQKRPARVDQEKLRVMVL